MKSAFHFFLSIFLLVPLFSVDAEDEELERIGTEYQLHDARNIRNGNVIPDEGYCDQPYIVRTQDGNWLCTLTTGEGREGQPGQHVVATISEDRGKTWGELIDIEPANGPEASWVVPLVTPSGRVYAFYDYNGDRVTGRRADMLGWYVYKYSDDHGRTWSNERYRLPVRWTACDENNGLDDGTQIFWGIDKPMIHQGSVYFAFTKLGRYMLEEGEGWLFHSSSILQEDDPRNIEWEMWPEGQHGIRNEEFGSVQEEHNLVPLSGDDLFCMYRTAIGHPCQSYSRDGGRTWSEPEIATYTPGGRKFKHNRACPKVWKTQNGKYLFWFNHFGGTDYSKRNPVWLCGGEEIDGELHWSQPEIVLYDPAGTSVRISYPDLIEEDGRYWISETQKSVARVHEINRELLKGLWNQGKRREIVRTGVVYEGEKNTFENPLEVDLRIGGFTFDFWLRLDEIKPGQILIDTRGNQEKGIQVIVDDQRNIKTVLSDGEQTYEWPCDPNLFETNQWHHVGILCDAGPRVLIYVIDGIVCDGDEVRGRGWGRLPDGLHDLESEKMHVGHNLSGVIKQMKIYDRALRISEVISNYNHPFSVNKDE